MIRIVLADDHSLVRKGIRALLENEDSMQVVGEADNGHEALALVEKLTPDVLLVDIAMPGLNGIQTAQRIAGSALPTRVVILSMHVSPSLVRRALKSGVKGYILKQSLTDELILAVRSASQGNTFLSPQVSDFVLEGYLSYPFPEDRPDALMDRLTEREKEVLQQIAEGDTNQAIAQRMAISVRTVERHRSNLMEKLDIHDIAGLTRFAIANNLIFLEEV